VTELVEYIIPNLEVMGSTFNLLLFTSKFFGKRYQICLFHGVIHTRICVLCLLIYLNAATEKFYHIKVFSISWLGIFN